MNTEEKAPALVIPLTPCKSSNISAHGYDTGTQTLALKFSSGATYHHDNVPAELAEKLAQAESVGSFFSTAIRGSFTGVKQPAPEQQ